MIEGFGGGASSGVGLQGVGPLTTLMEEKPHEHRVQLRGTRIRDWKDRRDRSRVAPWTSETA